MEEKKNKEGSFVEEGDSLVENLECMKNKSKSNSAMVN
jgi:hypothetical protein